MGGEDKKGQTKSHILLLKTRNYPLNKQTSMKLFSVFCKNIISSKIGCHIKKKRSY